ncbi:TonB-dependent receptor [Pseudodesulfovibrio sp. F-1]|uniref:TonB-dependent receptor n=1 Tax=Pseudodesulfovibrio alkaliphilus TaxID=2661613 RepID=A0A7K1KNS3_9BACT|nr:TonB-dependent receptor [Pseudodesulfovibrio alkaliphilus]MUM77746.1 TonB-dependent receptor [Pseudodesulfovibrio alkaliphilus]
MKRRFVVPLLAAFILTLGVVPASARDVTLNKVIVSARGVDSMQSQTPGGTGVVEKEEILLAPKASIADSISRIAGVSRSGESPWGQDVSIRGLSGASVVVLIDGMRLNTATEINARLGFINPLDVERVEVLKGPASALYGTGSTGGVINIITKKGAFTPQQELGGEMIAGWSTNPQGGDGYLRSVLSRENFWLQVSGGLRDHSSYYGGDATRMPNSQFDDIYLRMAGEARFSDLFTGAFQVMNIEASNVGIPGGSSTMPQTAPIRYPRTSNFLASGDLSFTPEGGTFKEVSLNLYYIKNERKVEIDNPTPAVRLINPQALHETLGGKLQTEMEFGDHSIVAGTDAWSWHMTSKRLRYTTAGPVLKDQPTPNTRQTSAGVFVEDDWKLDDMFTLNLGGRLDRVQATNKENADHSGSTKVQAGWNAHAGLTWNPAERWSHTFLAATSYRVPDILERFKNINLGGGMTSVGNPDLDPEKSYFFEYGLHYVSDSFSASGSVYANFLTDYIAETLDTPTQYRMANIGEARIYGSELEADWRFARSWSLYGNIALANGRDMRNKEALRSIAPVNGLGGIRYSNDSGFWARVETPWALGQSEVPGGVRRTDAWITVNTAAGYGFDWSRLHHEVSVSINNLFDKKYKNYLANSRSIELLEPGINGSINYAVTF